MSLVIDEKEGTLDIKLATISTSTEDRDAKVVGLAFSRLLNHILVRSHDSVGRAMESLKEGLLTEPGLNP